MNTSALKTAAGIVRDKVAGVRGHTGSHLHLEGVLHTDSLQVEPHGFETLLAHVDVGSSRFDIHVSSDIKHVQSLAGRLCTMTIYLYCGIWRLHAICLSHYEELGEASA